MWIVRLALRRTYTFVVMALLMVFVSLVAINRMSTDIFPSINIPVVNADLEAVLRQVFTQRLGHHDGAMASPRASDGNREVALAFFHIMRQQK